MRNGEENYQRRFSGVVKSYGEAAFDRFTNAHVCVLGIGGVGCWVVEALARSGVGTFTLVDLDVVAESNINRQLLALDETIGVDKIKVMADRISQINPRAEVHLVDDFVSVDNVNELLSRRFTYVVDCVDNFRVKAAVISACKNSNTSIITVGGAGGKINPELIKCADLSRTERDPLLAQTRKHLRQKYHFSRRLKDDFNVPAIYSVEQILNPLTGDDNSEGATGLSCNSSIGSLTHVTGSFAFAAVAIILRDLADNIGSKPS